MKNIFAGLFLLALITGGCKKNDQPAIGEALPVAAFKITNMSGGTVTEGKNLQLENNSINAVSYSWDFGNGIYREGKTPKSISYVPCGGSYTITLTVTNAAGKTATSSQSFIVACSGKNTHGMYLGD